MEKTYDLLFIWVWLLSACVNGENLEILPANYCDRFNEHCSCEQKADGVKLLCARAIVIIDNPYMTDGVSVYIRKHFNFNLYDATQGNMVGTISELSVDDADNSGTIIPSRKIMKFLGISNCTHYFYDNSFYAIEEVDVNAQGGEYEAKIKIQTGLLKGNDLRSFKNYTSLEIVHNGLFVSEPTYLSVLRKVRTLTLSSTFNCSFDLEMFKDLYSLRVLTIKFTPVDLSSQLNFDLTDLYGSDEDVYDDLCDTLSLNFRNLVQLHEIHLDRTFNSEVIEDELFQGSRHLKVLSIIGNRKLKNLNDNLFSDQTELTTLDLHSNALEMLPVKLFDNLNNLRTLNLSDNRYLRLHIDDNQLTNLLILDVSYDCEVFSYYYKDNTRQIEVIESNDSPIESNDGARTKPFVCFTHINCRLQLGTDDPCCLRKCNYTLARESMQFRIMCTEKESFGKYPLLIPIIGQPIAYIENINLTSLPTNELDGYANLTSVHAGGNLLTELHTSQLPTDLKYLDISLNNLSSLTEEVMAILEEKSIQLKLAGNPWQCNCQTKSLLRFMRQMHENIQDVLKIYCQGHKLPMFQLADEDICPNYAKEMLIGAVVVGMSFAFVVIFCCFAHKQNIKMWLYDHQMCLKLVSEEELDEGKVFDAFLSYSTKDEDFIMELLSKLEGEPRPYKLCLHDRDWLVGECIPDRIARTIEESRRVIIVLSQNFLDSPWGRMEFRLAYQASMEDRRKRLIIILYQEVTNFDKIDAELKAYINLNIYLKWGDTNFWRKLRYAMPHKNWQMPNANDIELEYRF